MSSKSAGEKLTKKSVRLTKYEYLIHAFDDDSIESITLNRS